MSDAQRRFAYLLQLQEECGGAIPFDRWMGAALAHPEYGYYTTGIRDIGRRGDFTTWPVLDDGLGKAIAAWIRTGGSRSVIEVGAGNGLLARAVNKAFPFWRRLDYHIVDISGPLRKEQQKNLRGFRVTWHESIIDALTATKGQATIFSNELVDAFPCRVLRKAAEGWEELHLQVTPQQFHTIWKPGAVADSTALAEDFPPGQIVEIHESYRAWGRDWLPLWKAGRMLTIDYGATCRDVYHRRPGGTLRAYAHQQKFTDMEIFRGFGRRDITADVNFSDLQQWGETLGLRTDALVPLADFVGDHLSPDSPVAEFLRQPGGAGEAFMALTQTRVS